MYLCLCVVSAKLLLAVFLRGVEMGSCTCQQELGERVLAQQGKLQEGAAESSRRLLECVRSLLGKRFFTRPNNAKPSECTGVILEWAFEELDESLLGDIAKAKRIFAGTEFLGLAMPRRLVEKWQEDLNILQMFYDEHHISL